MLAYHGSLMHIPDGFLSVPIALVFWLLSAGVISIALKQVGKAFGEREVPLMGLLAAAIFAGQMLNFSVAGGTSGHLLGAALATILLGPWGAMIVLTCVVAVQAVLFQDGGLLALGANLFNMAVIGVLVAYLVYPLVRRLTRGLGWGIFAAGFLAGWASVFLSALAAGLQLALSGTSPADIAVPAMGAVHALIGIGEGLITMGALALLASARPDLLKAETSRPSGAQGIWIGGSIVVLALAIASPLASHYPDGLEWVARQQGFLYLERFSLYRLIPGYLFPGIHNPELATIAGGLVGAGVVLALAWAVAASRRNRRQRSE